MLLEIGLGVLALGVLAFAYGVFQKVKAGRIADAPFVTTGDAAARGKAVANPRGAISAEGNVGCGAPLIAPMSGVPCLYYSLTCTATWKVDEEEKSKVVDERKVAADFTIDDGTGAVRVDLAEGGDFEPMQKRSESQSVGLLGGLKGDDLVFGHYRLSTGLLSLGTTYEVEEEYLPMQPRLYVCGKADEAGRGITAPNWRALLVSNQSRDALLGSATKGAKLFMIAGAAAFLLGGGTAGIGAALGGGDSASKAPDAPKAAVATPQAPAKTAAPAAKTVKK